MVLHFSLDLHDMSGWLGKTGSESCLTPKCKRGDAHYQVLCIGPLLHMVKGRIRSVYTSRRKPSQQGSCRPLAGPGRVRKIGLAHTYSPPSTCQWGTSGCDLHNIGVFKSGLHHPMKEPCAVRPQGLGFPIRYHVARSTRPT